MQNYRYFYWITITYFAIAFLNISLALAGLVCMVLPFVLLIKDQRKTWCAGPCPRASFLQLAGRWGRGHSIPKEWNTVKIRSFFLRYFCANLVFIVLSTTMVALGKVPPMDYIRLFMIIPTGIRVPQLFPIVEIPLWVIHFSYRIYSVMLSSTLLGLLGALLYKPRSWCSVCPVNTMSSSLLTKTDS